MIKKLSKITSYILIATLSISLTPSVETLAIENNDSSTVSSTIENITGTNDISLNMSNDEDYIVDGENSTIKIPRNSSQSITLTPAYIEDQAFGLNLPVESYNSHSNVSNKGTIVYTNDNSSVSFGVQPIYDTGIEGVRTLIAINNENSPKEYTFDFNLDEGTKLITDSEYLGEEFSSGEIFIINNENIIIGIIESPWAYDKNGTSISTNYKIQDGNKLIQTINFDENTVFPVVADPSAWQVTKCAGSLAWALGSTVFAGTKLLKIKKYIKALGGVKEAAALLVGATTWAEKMEAGGTALVNLAAEISGVKDIKENCFS